MSSSSDAKDDQQPFWPTAAASRIRVKVVQGNNNNNNSSSSSSYCRLYYNESTGCINLIPCNVTDDTPPQREIYDDSNSNIENEPYYQSYLATATSTSTSSTSTNANTNKTTNISIIDSFHPNDVIGAQLSLEYNIHNPNTFHGMKSYASAKYNIYSYPKLKKSNPSLLSRKNKNKRRRSAQHKQYSIDSNCCQDFGDARQIIQAIQRLANLYNTSNSNSNNKSSSNSNSSTSNNKPMKCLVILNPYSGGGGPHSKTGAKHIYQTMLQPMLEEAGVEHDALVTQHGGHAQERMSDRRAAESTNNNNNSKEEEEVGMNGNCNGNGTGTKHHDQEQQNETTEEDTTNTSCCSISTDQETNDISTYDAIIAMGGDGILFELFQGIHSRSDEGAILSTMKFGIIPCGTYNGLVKSLLHWSNNNDAEYDVRESIFQICKGYTRPLDVVNCTVFPQDDKNSNNSSSNNKSMINKSYLSFLSFAWGLIADCDYESEVLRWLGPLRSDIWAVYRGVLCRRRYHARFSYLPPNNDDTALSGKEVEMPTLGKPLPSGWKSIEDDFLVFWVCNTSHAAYNMYTCPMSKMNDGLFHVLVVRASCSRLKLIAMLLQLDSGGHVNHDDCEVIDCVAYQFEPLSDVSYNVLDGELLENGPIQASFLPGGAQFFVGE